MENRQERACFTISGLTCSTIAVCALFCLHLSWVSPTVSQLVGTLSVRVIALFILFPAIAGAVLSALGSGRGRVLGFLSCLAAGFWYIVLAFDSAISMGVLTARHSTHFLIPEGYVGWVEVQYDQAGKQPLNMVNGAYICRIPKSGKLATSSGFEEGWAEDKYFYYSSSNRLEPLKEAAWGLGGMVWGGEVSKHVSSANAEEVMEKIYIGTEKQFQQQETKPAN
jgi:hypothetical protein